MSEMPDAPSSSAEITSFEFELALNPVDIDCVGTIEGTQIHVALPYRTDLASLRASFTTTGARVEVEGVVQASGQTANNFTSSVTYRVFADDGNSQDYEVIVSALGHQQAYVKTATPVANAAFGTIIAFNVFADYMAVGAPSENSVYVFTRAGTNPWMQQARLTGTAGFGTSVALSAFGDTLAVGSPAGTGAAWVFVRSADVWSQQAELTPPDLDTGDEFGAKVAISGGGNTVAVSAAGDDSGATGISVATSTDNGVSNSGAAYVFQRTGTSWNQQAYIKAPVALADESFGFAVSFGNDGDTLAISDLAEGTGATASGAVHTFTRTGTTWSTQTVVKAQLPVSSSLFGQSIAMSLPGDVLVVGSPGESAHRGAAYVFHFITGTGSWSQVAHLTAANADPGDELGGSVAVGETTVVAGASHEAGRASGPEGNATDDSAADAGAAYVFRDLGGNVWTQELYVKASNPDAGDLFGNVAVAGDDLTFAVGAVNERSNASGIDGNQSDNSLAAAGAVYVFR
jgi:trimeric autotransporter adhesin